MFEALRATTFLGLMAAGIPAVVSAQAAAPGSLPPGQTPGQVEAHRPPITAGGFVKSGPIVFEDISEKAGLTRWSHKMGTPEKKYIVETKGSGVGLIDYDNDGWLDIYNRQRFDRGGADRQGAPAARRFVPQQPRRHLH